MVSGVQRIVLWFMSTLTVVTLLFGYHTSTSSDMASGGTSVVAPAPGTGTTGTGSDTTSGSTSDSSGTATGTDPGQAVTVTGSSTDTRWGPVQVQITVAGGEITDVTVVEYPTGNGKDRQINARALPVLVQETLDAQSADIDMVSGATVTSEGYIGSLQSALDETGL
jgi:major membrane immunogen (membrane-anchored lipoprotein)